jgi:hypothetical protein
MYFYEAKFVPTEEERVTLESPLLNDFPFFYIKRSDSNFALFTHFLIAQKKGDDSSPGDHRSFATEKFIRIFDRFCKENNIEYKSILRSAINNTWHYQEKMGPIHTDHDIPHYNFIMYLNDFTDGPTYIFDENEKKCLMFIPEKYKCIVFDGVQHSHGFCAPHERRVIFLVTFTI